MAYSLFLKSLFVLLLVLISGNSVFAQLPQLRGVDCNRINTQLYHHFTPITQMPININLKSVARKLNPKKLK